MATTLRQANAISIRADFDRVYDEFLLLVNGKELSLQTIVPFIILAIQVVEKVSEKSGDKGVAKKALALRLLQRLIEDLVKDKNTKKSLKKALETIGPSIIDGLIDADHGKLLKKGKSIWKKMRQCC